MKKDKKYTIEELRSMTIDEFREPAKRGNMKAFTRTIMKAILAFYQGHTPKREVNKNK